MFWILFLKDNQILFVLTSLLFVRIYSIYHSSVPANKSVEHELLHQTHALIIATYLSHHLDHYCTLYCYLFYVL